jgi:hypothetical protein
MTLLGLEPPITIPAKTKTANAIFIANAPMDEICCRKVATLSFAPQRPGAASALGSLWHPLPPFLTSLRSLATHN